MAILGAVASLGVVQSAHSAQDVVPLYTPALEQQLQPLSLPFAAANRKGGQILVFIAATHVFGTANATFRAVDSGVAAASPAIVILEGFPTAWGESPPTIMDKARNRGTAEGDDYTRGEATYIASVALSHGIYLKRPSTNSDGL